MNFEQAFTGSKVQRFWVQSSEQIKVSGFGIQEFGLRLGERGAMWLCQSGQGFHSRFWTAFGIRNFEKSVSFVKSNSEFAAKLEVFGKMSIFNEDFGSLMP